MRIKKGSTGVYLVSKPSVEFDQLALSRRLGTVPALTDSVKAGGDGANVII